MPEEVPEHVDHEDHRADAVHAGRDDRIPETLGVRLLGPNRWDVDFHRDRDGDEDAGGDVPSDDGHGERDDVSNAVREIAEQEEVADEPDGQRHHVRPVAPTGVAEVPAIQIREQRTAAIPDASRGVDAVDQTHAPRSHQGRDAEDVRQRSDGRGEEGNRRGREPPVLLIIIVPFAQRQPPPTSAVRSAVDDERGSSDGRLLIIGSAPRKPDV
nr:hypothetical protein CFP56_43746 [Quercus suber]